EFCLHHNTKELKRLSGFKHRTFNTTDLLYFIHFLQYHYRKHSSLEDAFVKNAYRSNANKNGNSAIQISGEDAVGDLLNNFYNNFFSLEDVPARTRKHIASPEKKSTCKRLNMFLRWMVRNDNKGVDFGIWKQIASSQLICPIDLHVARV